MNGAHRIIQRVAASSLLIPRFGFTFQDPWMIPATSPIVSLLRVTDGAAPRLATSVGLYYDESALNLVYRAQDDEVVATYLEHDQPLWEEDVVEVFLAPDDRPAYYEIEVNPLGTTFDARIESPEGVRATMKADLSWTCQGMFAAIRRQDMLVETIVRIPFASLGHTMPRTGDRWRVNFFRVDRSLEHGDEYSAWQPTLKTPPDFHVVSAFGSLIFG